MSHGVNSDGTAWVRAPEGTYTVSSPGAGATQHDLTITERPSGQPSLTDDEIRWAAQDAFCDAFGCA